MGRGRGRRPPPPIAWRRGDLDTCTTERRLASRLPSAALDCERPVREIVADEHLGVEHACPLPPSVPDDDGCIMAVKHLVASHPRSGADHTESQHPPRPRQRRARHPRRAHPFAERLTGRGEASRTLRGPRLNS